MHGGKSPGASKGNQHALKHGLYSGTEVEYRRHLRQILQASGDLIDKE
jgi:uncharacterized protein YjcR